MLDNLDILKITCTASKCSLAVGMTYEFLRLQWLRLSMQSKTEAWNILNIALIK